MSEVSYALQRIARGTGIFFVGMIISTFFGFLSRTVVARYFSASDYGVFSLALTVLNIALVIAKLGFQNSLPREVAFYNERDPSKIKALISTSLIIVSMNSIIWMAILIFKAEDIAQVFNEGRLVYALKIVAFALPFSALIGTVLSISRGFGRVKEQVYFQQFLYPLLWFSLIGIGTLVKVGFYYIFIAYVAANVITFFALVVDIFRLGLFKRGSVDLDIGKELIRFSVPLLLSSVLGIVMSWTDTLMLGYYKSSEFVGLYNVASPLARLITIFLGSVTFLYPPIASQLYAQGKIHEMRRVYQILTKWIFLLTLPVFSLMFLFPEVTISFFFGTKYLPAIQALRILALGFMLHTFLGLNGYSLIVIGKSKFDLAANLFAILSNILLNTTLIPTYGLEGAAIATAVSYFVANLLRSYWLYQETRIHPFNGNCMKPLIISFVMLGLIQSLHLQISSAWYTILVLTVFFGAYFFLVLLSKSLDKEDVELLMVIEKKLGTRFGVMEKILKKFV
ncbi:MAG: flippase [Thermosipho sp. (in: Bacteria)]|nr:flippase [Thermosipho sp. (in: thermotogales)]